MPTRQKAAAEPVMDDDADGSPNCHDEPFGAVRPANKAGTGSPAKSVRVRRLKPSQAMPNARPGCTSRWSN